MTNEELAVMAKAGDRSALTALWEQNTGLLAILFRSAVCPSGCDGDAGGRYVGGRRAMLLSCCGERCAKPMSRNGVCCFQRSSAMRSRQYSLS